MLGEGVTSSTPCWRESLVSQLQRRNRRECLCFQDIIAHHNSLFDKANTLRLENLHLNVQNEKLRCEAVHGTGGQGAIVALEAKLLAQQEELTQLHRNRGENAQIIIDLNKKLQEKDNAVSAADESVARAQALITSLKETLKKEKVARTETESQNQCLRDEVQALQLTLTHLEEKLRKAQDENLLLLDRLMKYKAKDAEKLNEENEHSMRVRAALLQKELEEAAKEVGKGVAFPPPDVTVPLSSSVPTNPSVVFNAHDGEVTAVKWNAVDRTLFTGGADRKVKFWNIGKVSSSSGSPDCKGVLVGSNQAVMSIDLDSTGTYVIGASNDFATRVWTPSDSRLKHTLTGHCGKVFAAKFLSEPVKIVTGSYDRTIKIWDLRERACIETKFAGSSCYDLVVSDGTGGTIISGHFDRKIRFWDTRSGEFVLNEILLQGKITSLDISKDRKYLLVCVRDDSLKIIDLRMNQISSTFSAEGFKVACDWTRAGFSSGGEHCAVGSSDGGVYVWNTATAHLTNVLKKHTAAVLAISWHPFSNSLASVDKSKQVVVWTDV